MVRTTLAAGQPCYRTMNGPGISARCVAPGGRDPPREAAWSSARRERPGSSDRLLDAPASGLVIGISHQGATYREARPRLGEIQTPNDRGRGDRGRDRAGHPTGKHCRRPLHPQRATGHRRTQCAPVIGSVCFPGGGSHPSRVGASLAGHHHLQPIRRRPGQSPPHQGGTHDRCRGFGRHRQTGRCVATRCPVPEVPTRVASR